MYGAMPADYWPIDQAVRYNVAVTDTVDEDLYFLTLGLDYLSPQPELVSAGGRTAEWIENK
jgi:hypothetical protein